uniref:RING-type E3 ubiquitin transferase n=1 Tax=Amphimedon queenslandica TaxID=400682 RepID=A0A1X7V582_AMPQE
MATGRHRYRFVDGEPRDELKCSICTFVLCDPHQVTCCAKRFCKSCLDQMEDKRCPLCREPINYFKDGGINRKVIALKVHCTNSEEGCEWQGTINETGTSIDTHLNSCTYQLYCNQKGRYKLITSRSHYAECPDLSIQCSNEGCNMIPRRRSQASHNETCPKAIVPCEYNTVGCEKRMKREEQEKHNEESITAHLQLTKKQLQVTKEQQQIFRHYFYKKKGNEIWYSPGFYISPGGYKISLRVDPNGNGDSKGTHIACYIYLEAGVHDDILEWPFQGVVTTELLNQLEDKNHWKNILSFHESTPEKCKQKVREGRSAGWGNPEFISHKELKYNPTTNCQYLKDDSLYFRVSVKATQKTKPWLVGASQIIEK